MGRVDAADEGQREVTEGIKVVKTLMVIRI